MVADLDRPFTHIRHVAIRTGDSATGVDSLGPGLEFRMLGLQHLGAASCVGPIAVPVHIVVVIRLDLVGLEPAQPWVCEELSVPLEIILDMTLAADEAAHLLPVCFGV